MIIKEASGAETVKPTQRVRRGTLPTPQEPRQLPAARATGQLGRFPTERASLAEPNVCGGRPGSRDPESENPGHSSHCPSESRNPPLSRCRSSHAKASEEVLAPSSGGQPGMAPWSAPQARRSGRDPALAPFGPGLRARETGFLTPPLQGSNGCHRKRRHPPTKSALSEESSQRPGPRAQGSSASAPGKER